MQYFIHGTNTSTKFHNEVVNFNQHKIKNTQQIKERKMSYFRFSKFVTMSVTLLFIFCVCEKNGCRHFSEFSVILCLVLDSVNYSFKTHISKNYYKALFF